MDSSSLSKSFSRTKKPFRQSFYRVFPLDIGILVKETNFFFSFEKMKGQTCDFELKKVVELLNCSANYTINLNGTDKHRKQLEDFGYAVVIILLFLLISVLFMVKNTVGNLGESEVSLERFRLAKLYRVGEEKSVRQQLIRLKMFGKILRDTRGFEDVRSRNSI